MTKTRTISVKGREITISRKEQEDYISLTDIARYRDAERTDYTTRIHLADTIVEQAVA